MIICGEFASVEAKSANKVNVENYVFEMLRCWTGSLELQIIFREYGSLWRVCFC